MNRTVFSLPEQFEYATRGGLLVKRSVEHFFGGASRLDGLIELLDRRRGVVLSSGTTVPGRYESFDLGFSDPPLVLETTGVQFSLAALNARGEVLIAFLADTLRDKSVVITEKSAARLAGHIIRGEAPVEEDQRTRRASVMSLVRDMVASFAAGDDGMLGLFGAFAYDLVFQIEDLVQKRPREKDQRDIVLYVPDQLLAYDRATSRGAVITYDFSWKGKSTAGLSRETRESVYAKTPRQGFADHAPGEYQATVELARGAFARGDLFEAVPGQLFGEPCERSPAEVFQRLCRINPSPYGALMNLGDGEFLVSASPEMFVRSDGRRVETCPISGTIARGVDAIGDAEQIRQLLNSEKDEFELNMCTDVDRNDKARVCVPGTIKVLARRQIETYSKLFHTVDHVEGMLRPGFDALDAFLTHAWAVTVTGAPKLWAMQFVEDHERSPRRWYAGAIGCVNFDGSINTGLTIRTIRMKDGIAEVRVGATCLFEFGVRRRGPGMPGQGGGAVPGAARRPGKAAVEHRAGCDRKRQAGAFDRPRRQFRAYAGGLFPPGWSQCHGGPLCACARHAEAEKMGPAGAVAGTGPAAGLRHIWYDRCRPGEEAADLRSLPGRAGDR